MSAQKLYGDLADRYAAHSSTGAIYLEYERPASRAGGLCGGLSVLDLGCGPGDHLAWLLFERAADICHARFPGIAVHQVDLRSAWDFASDASFDLIVSSLALHYVADWTVALREAHRALRPGGRIVVSTHHPFDHVVAIAV